MERTYTNVGKEYTQGKESDFNGMFERLNWLDIPCDLPAMPGLGIKEVIKELRIPKVYQVAYSNELAPYGLYGVKAKYKNGNAVIYMRDNGVSITILASDFYPNEN